MAIEEAIKITVDTNAEDAANQLDKLNAELRETAAQYLKLNESEKKSAFGKGLAKQMETLQAQIKGTTNETKELAGGIEKAEKAAIPLKTQLRKIIEELATMEEGSPAYINLAKQAGDLTGQIEAATNTSKLFKDSLGEQALAGVIGSLSLVTSGFGAVQGAMALFGGQSKELDKVLTQVNATMLILNSLQQIQGNLQKDSAARIFLTTTAQNLYNSAVKASTLSTATFNTVLAASGVGLALLAVTFLPQIVEWLSNSSDATVELTEAQKRNNEAISRTNELYAGEIVELRRLTDRLLETNSTSKERKDLLDEINSKYGITIQNLKDEAKFAGLVAEAYGKIVEKIRAKVLAQAKEEIAGGIEKRIQEIISTFEKQGAKIEESFDAFGNRLFEIPAKSAEGYSVFITGEMEALLDELNNLNTEQSKIFGDLSQLSAEPLQGFTKTVEKQAKTIREEFPKMKGDIDSFFKFVIDGNKRLSDEFDPQKNPQSFLNALKYDISKETDAKMYQQYLAVITSTNEAATDSEEQRLQREKDIFSARQELYAQTASVFGNLSQIVAVEGKGLTDTQKALALVQIGIDTARALSSALAATYGTTPEPIAAAIKYATVAANILATAGKIRQVLSSGHSSNIQPPSGVIAAPDKIQAVSTVGGTTNVNVNVDISERDLRKANLRAAERRRGATVVV
jgi:hypothetical protein